MSLALHSSRLLMLTFKFIFANYQSSSFLIAFMKLGGLDPNLIYLEIFGSAGMESANSWLVVVQTFQDKKSTLLCLHLTMVNPEIIEILFQVNTSLLFNVTQASTPGINFQVTMELLYSKNNQCQRLSYLLIKTWVHSLQLVQQRNIVQTTGESFCYL